MASDYELARILSRKEKLKQEMAALVEGERKRRKVVREKRAMAVLKALEILGVDDEMEAALAQPVKTQICQNSPAEKRLAVLVQGLHQRSPVTTTPTRI